MPAGCDWDTLIVVDEPLLLELDLGTDLIIDLGDSVQIHANFNIPLEAVDTLIWRPFEYLNCNDEDCFSPWTNTWDDLTYLATLVDTSGCTAEARVAVDVQKDRNVYIPNAFSPNGDAENDLFFINAGETIAKVNSFYIYNRWGELVFEAYNFQPNDPEVGWDGYFRGQLLNPAVFVYWAEIEYIDGVTELFKGDVTLMK